MEQKQYIIFKKSTQTNEYLELFTEMFKLFVRKIIEER